MAIQVQEIVSAVASSLNVDDATAQSTVGTILSVIDHEAAGTKVDELFDKIDGARELAQRFDVMAPAASGTGGGLMNMLGSALGERAGALINGVSRLRNSGLTMEQVEQAGTQLFAKAEKAAGPGLVKEITDSVPGLASHFGG